MLKARTEMLQCMDNYYFLSSDAISDLSKTYSQFMLIFSRTAFTHLILENNA